VHSNQESYPQTPKSSWEVWPAVQATLKVISEYERCYLK